MIVMSEQNTQREAARTAATGCGAVQKSER